MGMLRLALLTCAASGVGSSVFAQTPTAPPQTTASGSGQAAPQSAPTSATNPASPEGSVLGEIVVTAQKREQKIQSVGIAITAFSGQQLQALGVTRSEDLVQVTPGLRNPQSGSGLTASYSLRGLSQTDYGASQEAPVALYVDEVYQASQGTSQFLLFDLDRTEVLRGPQGTLFGRNATGGLVHIITKKPTDELGGYADISYGRFNEVRPEGAINIPITSTLSTRLSFAGDWRDAITKNTTGPDLWDEDRYAGRLEALWKPNSDFSFLVSARAAQVREVGQAYVFASARPTGEAGGGEFTPGQPDLFGFTNTGNNKFKVSVDPVSFHNIDTQGVTGTINWNLGGLTLTSITDFTHVHVSYEEDSDMQPGEFFHYRALQNSNQISQEVRLSGKTGDVRWVTGLYYLNVDGNYFQEGLISALGFPGVTAEDTPYAVTTHSGSVFGQVEYQPVPQFRAILGARYVYESKHQDYAVAFKDVPGGTSVGFGSSPELLTFNGGLHENLYSLKAEADYIPNNRLLFYASYNRGVKAGGFNAPLDPSGSSLFIDPVTFDPAPTADASLRYGPETLHAFEAGVKSTLFEGRVRANASVFYYDYRNFQALNFQGISTSFITNRNATLKGIDTELFASPIHGLDIVLGASYLDQEVDAVPIGTAVLNRRIPYAPKWNLTWLFRYEWPVLAGKLAAQLNGNYVSTQYLGLTNSPVLREPGYAISNARLTYTFPDRKVSVALYVDNLTNTIYRSDAFDLAGSFGSVEQQIGLPRTYGIRLHYQWGGG